MRLHWIALSAVAVVLLVAVATSPATAQNRACDAVFDNATNATAGPGGQLADAIGEQGSEIGDELNDRWFDARIANATSDASRADVIADEVDRIEVRLNRTERCWRENSGDDESEEAASELTSRQSNVLEQRALSLHRRLNETRDHASTLPSDLRERHDIGPERFAALERRVIALREILSE